MLASILSNKFPSKNRTSILHEQHTSKPEAIKQGKRTETHTVEDEWNAQQHRTGRNSKKNSVRHKVKKVHFSGDCKNGIESKSPDSQNQGKGKDRNHGKANGDTYRGPVLPHTRSFLSSSLAARLDYLSEMDASVLKQVHSNSMLDRYVSYCDNEHHLKFGVGPDHSQTFIGLMNNNVEVAVKKINKKRASTLADEKHRNVITSLNHPSLARVLYISSDKTHYYVVRELCDHSLAYKFRMRGFIPADVMPDLDREDLCYQIASAVSALHRHSLPHMSLKPENIFLTPDDEVKLADYQLHERYSANKHHYANVPSTLAWLPSEALLKPTEFTLASDIASLGMIFYWIITEGGHPFGDHLGGLEKCLKNCRNGQYNLKAIADPFAHHLLQRMICKEPEKRLTVGKVLDHPYFWKEDDRIAYLQLLAAVFCDDKTYQAGCDIALRVKQCLKEKQSRIEKLLSNKSKNLEFLLCDRFDVVKVMNCLSGACDENCAQILSKWPGLLLETYSRFGVDDLKSALESEERLRSISESDSYTLRACLSVDSGVHVNWIGFNADRSDLSSDDSGNHHGSRSRFVSGDSECCSLADYGIDVMSPVADFLQDEPCFRYPAKSEDKGLSETLRGKSKDEFATKINSGMEKLELKPKRWTDMDELD